MTGSSGEWFWEHRKKAWKGRSDRGCRKGKEGGEAVRGGGKVKKESYCVSNSFLREGAVFFFFLAFIWNRKEKFQVEEIPFIAALSGIRRPKLHLDAFETCPIYGPSLLYLFQTVLPFMRFKLLQKTPKTMKDSQKSFVLCRILWSTIHPLNWSCHSSVKFSLRKRWFFFIFFKVFVLLLLLFPLRKS